jgi:hypothetical protein
MDECAIGTWPQHTSFHSWCCLNGAQSHRVHDAEVYSKFPF